MIPTNKYIADHALKLFNKNGFVNVRLQQIADAAFVSVGHLAYHFKNKEAIVDFLFESHRGAGQNLLQAYRVMPLFQDVNAMLRELYLLQESYSFLYTDMVELVRAYPALLKKHSEHAAWQRIQLGLMLSFQVARGALQMPNNRVTIELLAQNLLMHLNIWRYQQLILADANLSFEAFCNDVWLLLLPYCTPLGLIDLQIEH
jgi:AcrR family transcriptional regulator